MPRPVQSRRVSCEPGYAVFKPCGVQKHELKAVLLELDEFEALRLADVEGLYQEAAAEQMGVSRQTFGNIITAARQKVADALVNGKLLRIEGGHIKMVERKFICDQCQHTWTLPFGSGRPEQCPECQSQTIHRQNVGRGRRASDGFCGGRGRCRRGRV